MLGAVKTLAAESSRWPCEVATLTKARLGNVSVGAELNQPSHTA